MMDLPPVMGIQGGQGQQGDGEKHQDEHRRSPPEQTERSKVRCFTSG
jgi:hypothetical protein